MSRERSRSNDRGSRREERDNGDAPAPSGNAKLFVANLTYNTSEKELEDLFSKHGRIVEVRLAIASDTGRSKGFAFVTMEDARDAAEAVKALNGYEIDGRSLKVEVAHGEGPRRGGGGGGRDRGGPRSMVCYDWRRGTCQRGDTCRFNHFEEERRAGGRDDYRGERYGRDRSRDRGGYRDRDDRGDRYRGRDRSRDRSRDRYERRDRSRDRY